MIDKAMIAPTPGFVELPREECEPLGDDIGPWDNLRSYPGNALFCHIAA